MDRNTLKFKEQKSKFTGLRHDSIRETIARDVEQFLKCGGIIDAAPEIKIQASLSASWISGEHMRMIVD